MLTVGDGFSLSARFVGVFACIKCSQEEQLNILQLSGEEGG